MWNPGLKKLKGSTTIRNLQLWKEGVTTDCGKDGCGNIFAERVNAEAWFKKFERNTHKPATRNSGRKEFPHIA